MAVKHLEQDDRFVDAPLKVSIRIISRFVE